QKELPKGATLVLVFFASDGTQLSTHSGDHELWPHCMSIRNLPSSLHAKPSSNSWILLAVLPIPPKKDDHLEKDADGRPRKVTGKKETEMYQKAKDEVLHQVLELIVKEMNGLYEDGIELSYTDGFIRDG